MTWQPYESQGAAAIDALLAERVEHYLESKESHLGMEILGSIHHLQDFPLVLKPTAQIPVKLHEAVEGFGKKVRRLCEADQREVDENEWKISAEFIEKSLWNYIEILEGAVTELFQQLDQIGFEQWNTHMVQATASIKDILAHRLDDLIWAIRRLKQQLSDYRDICKKKKHSSSWARKIFWKKTKVLDSLLEPTVVKCRKFLGFRYQKFTEKCSGYQLLHQKIEESLDKFNGCRTLAALDLDAQKKFKKIYQLLKLWEFNSSSKTLPQNDVIRAVRNTLSEEGVEVLIREYASAIRSALFDNSRKIKKKFHLVFLDKHTRKPILENVASYRAELHLLGAVSAKYREFLQRTDPNPYVRSRWGFSEWMVGPEPKPLKHLRMFIFDIEHLDKLCGEFQSSIESEQALESRLTPELEAQVAHHLREMGQPLASKTMIQEHAQGIIACLEQLDEIGTFHQEVVEYVCKVLCKGMKADWRYHTLYDLPLFHQLYEVHQGVIGPIEDRQHVNRLHKFQRILDQLTSWIKKNESLKHAHEMELDINDIKAYLQDFFAHVQAIGKDSALEKENRSVSLSKANQALLEYRYAFGKFFHQLRGDIPEERLIRKQLLFVDQYFEAIENHLQELDAS